MADWSAGEQHTIGGLLAERLRTDPDGPYLDLCGTPFTAREVDAAANALAAGLAEIGVTKGDRVASVLENGPESVLFFFAVTKLGAVAVPVNTAYKGSYLRHQLADSGARCLVVQGDLADRAKGVVEGLDTLTDVVVAPPGDGADAGAGLAGVIVHRWADLVASHAGAGAPEVDIVASDLACFIYTGGTTGPSKGCMITHTYTANLARQIGRVWGRTADDVVWTPLPMFHFNAIVTVVVGTLLYGGRGALAKRFSVSGFWPDIARTGATITSTLGSMAVMVAGADDNPHTQGTDSPEAAATLRLFAAVPLSPATERVFNDRFGVDCYSAAYGTTECSLVSSLPATEKNEDNAAGRVNDVEFEVRIFDDHDVEVPVGEPGEIVVRPKAPHVMFEGYWGNPVATLEASRNWWFHTGDIGRVDDDGFLYFVDRKADYLRRRGENISTFEMEKVLYGHPAIAEVAVHAVPSEVSEDDVKVTAVRRPDADCSEEELCRWLDERVPYFALPRYIEFRTELPKNPVGRILKYELRADGVTDATWDRDASGFTFEKR